MRSSIGLSLSRSSSANRPGLHQPLDLHAPGRHLQGMGIARGVCFVGAEFIGIVVAGGILVAGGLLPPCSPRIPANARPAAAPETCPAPVPRASRNAQGASVIPAAPPATRQPGPSAFIEAARRDFAGAGVDETEDLRDEYCMARLSGWETDASGWRRPRSDSSLGRAPRLQAAVTVQPGEEHVHAQERETRYHQPHQRPPRGHRAAQAFMSRMCSQAA